MATAVNRDTKKNSTPVRERAYEALKNDVLSGRFRPGERLTEEHLATELGVSRTPVREALHKLELEGLVEPLEARGFCVAHDSREEMEELFELRAVMEGYALRKLAGVITEETIDQLMEYVSRAETALVNRDIKEIFRWNTVFHDTLHNLLADKRRTHSLITNIRKYVLRYRKNTLAYMEGAQHAIEGHRMIVLALKSRDPELCERVMRNHIEQAREDALQTTAEKAPEAG